MLSTLTEVAHEQARQRELWGVQNLPSFTEKNGYFVWTASLMRTANELAIRADRLSWEHILLEEVAEAMEERTDPARLREELVQVCAVAASWIECLDRNAE